MKINLTPFQVSIDNRLYKLFRRHIQNSIKSNESGGILIGNIIDKNDIIIHKITEPNSFDKSSRYGFERDKQIAQIILDFEFSNSGGRNIYLGEWHTHPEKNAIPSGQDKKMILQQFKRNKLNSQTICLIIIGIETSYIGLYSRKGLISEARFKFKE